MLTRLLTCVAPVRPTSAAAKRSGDGNKAGREWTENVHCLTLRPPSDDMNAPNASSYRGWSGRRPRRAGPTGCHHLPLPTPSPRSLRTSSTSFRRPQCGQGFPADDACSDGCAQLPRLSFHGGDGCDADSGRKLKLLARRFKAEWTDSAHALCFTERPTTRSKPCASGPFFLVKAKPSAPSRSPSLSCRRRPAPALPPVQSRQRPAEMSERRRVPSPHNRDGVMREHEASTIRPPFRLVTADARNVRTQVFFSVSTAKDMQFGRV